MNESCCPGETLCPHNVHLPDALKQFERQARRGVFDTGRYRCSYYCWGEGPTLLIIPGLSDQALSFVMVAAVLAENLQCVAYDLPTGAGDGARLSRYAHSDLAADTVAVLDHVGARQSIVLGSSFGATIALAALAAYPDRLTRAVLQGGFALRPLAPAEVLLAHFARFWPGSMRRLPLRRAILQRMHAEPFAPREPDVWDFYLTRTGAPPIAAVARRALLLHRFDLRGLLPAVRQPVLLISGDCDPLVGESCQHELLRGLPNADRVELPGCGHNPQFTHPEALAQLVYAFATAT